MKILLVCIAAVMVAGCNNSGPVAVNSNAPSSQPKNEKQQTVIAHSTENKTLPNVPPADNSAPKSKWAQGGTPIDTKEFDAAIAKAQTDLKAKPTNPALIIALSVAYYKRGVALTDARQYAAALGDYRRTLKYDPANAEAKDWVEQIIKIYDGMNKEYPKEGEEPPALPFEKGK